MTGLLASVALAGSAQAEAMVVAPHCKAMKTFKILPISYLATPAQEVFVSKSICEVTGTPCAIFQTVARCI